MLTRCALALIAASTFTLTVGCIPEDPDVASEDDTAAVSDTRAGAGVMTAPGPPPAPPPSTAPQAPAPPSSGPSANTTPANTTSANTNTAPNTTPTSATPNSNTGVRTSCRQILSVRQRDLADTDTAAEALAADAYPGEKELWQRLKTCAQANRCNYNSIYPGGCLQRFCKQQHDQCQFSSDRDPPPPEQKIWTCTARGFVRITINGVYSAYSMTRNAEHRDRDAAIDAAVQSCNEGVGTLLNTHRPGQITTPCNLLFCL